MKPLQQYFHVVLLIFKYFTNEIWDSNEIWDTRLGRHLPPEFSTWAKGLPRERDRDMHWYICIKTLK